MKDWRKRRQDSLSEFTLSAHILVYLITIIIFITGTSIEQYTFYSATILLVVIVLPSAFLILLDIHFLNKKYGRRVMNVWNIIKHTFLLGIITAVLSSFHSEQLWLFSSIYLIPVLLSCINMGKWWGITFAGGAVGSFFWLSRGIVVAGNQAVGQLEAALVLGSIFFLLAWLLGGILEVEKKTTENIRQEHDLIARMMETNPAGIIVLDHHRNIVFSNSRAEQVLSLQQGEPQEIFSWEKRKDTPLCLDEVVHKVLTLGEPVYAYPGTVYGFEGNISHLSVSGAPIFNSSGDIEQVVLTVDDITVQKKMSDELLKANKLESLGLLAGGITHDFNNFLTIMLGNISLMKIKNKNKKMPENLDHMEKAVLQARELTRKLAIFARGEAPVKSIIHLRDLLFDTVGFATSGSGIICHTKVAEDLFPVEIDETQIGQVINNVLINAIQAMPKGGNITLTASNKTLSGHGEGKEIPLPDGDYVCIEISDEGAGIPANLMDKIFDPFFTTKTHGSGLGLAISYTIIKNHNGLIRVESQLDVGTKFFIYLPSSIEPSPIHWRKDEELYFGEGRVLIMDDDELILNVCGNMLRHLGYCVSYARDGMEAIRLYQEAAEAGNGFAYDIVIMDLTIPGGVGGEKTIELLRQLDPDVKAIVSSGHYSNPVISHYKKYGFLGFVKKPYRIKELSEALRKVMQNIA